MHPWLVSIGFKQGKDEPCVFRHEELNITVASYVDDIACRGPRARVPRETSGAEEFPLACRIWFK